MRRLIAFITKRKKRKLVVAEPVEYDVSFIGAEASIGSLTAKLFTTQNV